MIDETTDLLHESVQSETCTMLLQSIEWLLRAGHSLAARPSSFPYAAVTLNTARTLLVQYDKCVSGTDVPDTSVLESVLAELGTILAKPLLAESPETSSSALMLQTSEAAWLLLALNCNTGTVVASIGSTLFTGAVNSILSMSIDAASVMSAASEAAGLAQKLGRQQLALSEKASIMDLRRVLATVCAEV